MSGTNSSTSGVIRCRSVMIGFSVVMNGISCVKNFVSGIIIRMNCLK